jgi:hypothetical protein
LVDAIGDDEDDASIVEDGDGDATGSDDDGDASGRPRDRNSPTFLDRARAEAAILRSAPVVALPTLLWGEGRIRPVAGASVRDSR